MADRLEEIIQFLGEIDKLKHVKRRSHVSKEHRPETVAEHSWHMAMFALLLHKEFSKEVSLEKLLKLILVHDLVEIYAGDTFAFDEVGAQDKKERELKAADDLFAILPADLGEELKELWFEFEDGNSAEAVYARSLDRLQVVNENILSEGHVWLTYGIDPQRVIDRNQEGVNYDPLVHELFFRLIDNAKQAGYFPTKGRD